MIEDHYKTKILITAVHLKIMNGSAMSSLGKATLHLQITNFKFSHAFVICDKLPDTDILFGIEIKKSYSVMKLGCRKIAIHTQGRLIFSIHQEL